MLPDFLIIGAMKCGTSTLAAQLQNQPGVFISSPKEPNFFSDDDVYQRGLAWYERLFDTSKPNDLRGEASTHYTKLPTHPHTLERMRDVLSTPRLVYMVRNPVERLVSHYIHEWTERRIHGDIETAVRNHTELVEYGLYAKQIAPFVDAFGVEAICLTSLERIKADPQSELERVAAHISYDGNAIWQHDLNAQNVSSQRVRKLPFHSVLVDNPVSRTLRRSLVPKTIRTKMAAVRKMEQRPTLSDQLEEHLLAQFAPDQAQLAELFPEVLTNGTQRNLK